MARSGRFRGGTAAAEHLIAALHCVYRYAIADRLLDAGDSPATRVDKPHRQPSQRYALPDPALAAIMTVAGETGNDPDLDLPNIGRSLGARIPIYSLPQLHAVPGNLLTHAHVAERGRRRTGAGLRTRRCRDLLERAGRGPLAR